MRSTAQSIESWKRFWGWDWTTPWCGRMGALKLSEPFVEIIFQNTFEIWERVMNILCNQMKFDVKNKKNDTVVLRFVVVGRGVLTVPAQEFVETARMFHAVLGERVATGVCACRSLLHRFMMGLQKRGGYERDLLAG